MLGFVKVCMENVESLHGGCKRALNLFLVYLLNLVVVSVSVLCLFFYYKHYKQTIFAIV